MLSKSTINSKKIWAWSATLALVFGWFSSAADFDRIRLKVEELPQQRIEVRITSDGIFVDGMEVTHKILLDRLRESPKSHVRYFEEKFVRPTEGHCEEIALLVLRSGGRFFYQQGRGSIDSIFYCYEFVERLPAASGERQHEAEQVGTGQPATRPESKSEGSDKPQPKSEGRSR